MASSKLLVDIESLLDLRQAILSDQLNQKELVNFINSDEYNFRQTDIFKNVDMDKYEQTYKNMAIRLLPKSNITYIINVLNTKIQSLEKRNSYHKENNSIEIWLNVYPFNLDDETCTLLRDALFAKLKFKCNITVVHLEPSKITPYLIKNSLITSCFIHNSTERINQHAHTLENIKLPDTLFYFPAIYKIEDTEGELKVIQELGHKDVFSFMEYIFSVSTSATFLPILFYTNLITSEALVEKYNKTLKTEPLGKIEEVKLPDDVLDILKQNPPEGEK